MFLVSLFHQQYQQHQQQKFIPPIQFSK